MDEKEKAVLDLLETPSDIRKLNHCQLKRLAQELRSQIIEVTTQNGGHLASSLGVVELTLALHRSFSLPDDLIVWDVGHQTYAHKILTHGKARFATLRQKGGLSGFSRPEESCYDAFVSGHASNSISAALGLLEGKRLAGKKDKVVAVIGDGALTGGMTFEGFNHAGFLKRDLIVVLNDNQMSIGKNVGALSSHTLRSPISSLLTGFAVRPSFFKIRYAIDRFLPTIPFLGSFLYHLRRRFRNAVKALLLKENLFGDLGFVYVGPIDGHNEERLERILKRVKKIPIPVLVHVVTRKGKGLAEAEADPLTYHGVPGGKGKGSNIESFTQCFSQWMKENGDLFPNMVGVSAAMAEGAGLAAFREAYPHRFYDVGIAEEHAVTFAAGLAKEGSRPVVAIYSTFMQRAVDQVIHDVAIQRLPVVFVLDRAGLVGGDGETHQGIFDVSLYRSIPTIEILLPSTQGQLNQMLTKALHSDHPVMIRIAKDNCMVSMADEAPFQEGRGALVYTSKGSKQLLIACGAMLSPALEAAKGASEKGVATDLYDLRTIKPFDEEYFLNLIKNYQRVFLYEDNMSLGGVGEFLSSYFIGNDRPYFAHFGIPQVFPQHATREELMEEFSLSSSQIEQQLLKSVSFEKSKNQ